MGALDRGRCEVAEGLVDGPAVRSVDVGQRGSLTVIGVAPGSLRWKSSALNWPLKPSARVLS